MHQKKPWAGLKVSNISDDVPDVPPSRWPIAVALCALTLVCAGQARAGPNESVDQQQSVSLNKTALPLDLDPAKQTVLVIVADRVYEESLTLRLRERNRLVTMAIAAEPVRPDALRASCASDCSDAQVKDAKDKLWKANASVGLAVGVGAVATWLLMRPATPIHNRSEKTVGKGFLVGVASNAATLVWVGRF